MEKKKVLGKIKLTQLKKTNLEQREMNVLKGGVCANCACVNYDYQQVVEAIQVQELWLIIN